MDLECENFDAYLAEDLPAKGELNFERHLPHCDACRDAIERQRWIDDLLQSPARLQVEPIPIHLIEVARASAARRHSRARFAACGLAAAAMLVVALGWLELNR